MTNIGSVIVLGGGRSRSGPFFSRGGKYGRERSTICRVPGYAGFGRDRPEATERHATREPVALIADALLDFSHDAGRRPFDAAALLRH